jgi:hypothetical protein
MLFDPQTAGAAAPPPDEGAEPRRPTLSIAPREPSPAGTD